MKTTENRKRWNLRRWLVPASLAAALLVLPGAASTAEAHGPPDYVKKAHKHAHRHAHKAAKYAHKHFTPVHVSYYRPRVYRPVAFYLETPYVVVHGPRVDARVVYYPGDVALYQPGYCPTEVHYHPYEDNDRVDVDVHTSVSVHIDF
jgi:hypothetical protein